MGNVINKDNDTIKWNNLKTDKISEGNDSHFLTDDSKLLASRLVLNIPDVQASESENFEIEKIFNKYQVTLGSQKNGSELSDTSPFISSEMYKYLMNKNQIDEVKVGGGLKQKGGAVDEDSSTSSTSSSEAMGSKGKHNDKENKKKNKKQNKESTEASVEIDTESVEPVSDGLSYVSSSAHTEDKASEKSSAKSSEESNKTTSEKSDESVSNNNNQVPPSSINTSDINMITESS